MGGYLLILFVGFLFLYWQTWRPSRSCPEPLAIAACASAALLISTMAQPRVRPLRVTPVSHETTFPYSDMKALRVSEVVSHARFPTKRADIVCSFAEHCLGPPTRIPPC